MAIYPAAKLRNIPPGVNDPAIIAMGAILHVDAANSGSLYSYFNGPSGGIESHFFVRKDGVVEQYRDTKYEADANYHANSFVKGGKTYGYISIETQGFASGEWNAAQLAEIKKLLVWLSHTHNFPLKKCATPADPGVGWHVMFGAPGPWTPHAKVCPGPDRVKQYNEILVPWFKTAVIPPAKPVIPPPVTPPKEDTLSAQDVEDGIDNYMQRYYSKGGTGGINRAEDEAWQKAMLDAANRQAAALETIATNLTPKP
jgi:hypothetical protein